MHAKQEHLDLQEHGKKPQNYETWDLCIKALFEDAIYREASLYLSQIFVTTK